jgi:acyl dehydratase
MQEVEKGAIRRFADAIGDPNPIYHDESAARAAGYRGLVAPPTFAVTFSSAQQFLSALDVLGGGNVKYRSLLHGEQTFEYLKPIVAGDRITVRSRIADVQERAGTSGPMDFVVIEDEGKDEGGELVFKSRKTIILRRG